MKNVRDRINEDHARAGKAGKVLPTTLPKVPVPRENDNKDYVHKFKLAKYPGGDPTSFDVDTHH